MIKNLRKSATNLHQTFNTFSKKLNRFIESSKQLDINHANMFQSFENKSTKICLLWLLEDSLQWLPSFYNQYSVLTYLYNSKEYCSKLLESSNIHIIIYHSPTRNSLFNFSEPTRCHSISKWYRQIDMPQVRTNLDFV